MKPNWRDKLKNYAAIQRVLVFLISALIIFLFLPKESLFQYEYQLNQPWKHEKLMAPFDFGVYKTDEELAAERQVIQDAQEPILSIDRTITEQALHRIDEAMFASIDSSQQCDSLRKVVMQRTSEMLTKGILKQVEEFKDVSADRYVLVERGGTLSKTRFGSLHNLTWALDSLRSILQNTSLNKCDSLLYQSVVKNLNTNLVYNDILTQAVLSSKLQDVILVEGKVNKGQAIIDEGELVTTERFKVLESLKKEYATRTISETGVRWSLIGEMGVVMILLGLLMLFIQQSQDRLFNDPRPMTLSLALVTLSFVITSLAESSTTVSAYAIPIGITPLLLRMFYDFRVSIFSFFILVLISALFFSNPLEFIVLQTSAISLATLYQSESTKRSRMLGTAVVVFLGYSLIYLVVALAQNGNLDGVSTSYFGWFAINAFLCMMVFPLIYVVEKIFGYVSETTLLELSDSNQPLLKELAVKAPGTFQHSLQVANLAEKIAARVGGNQVLLRTAAMYHDIGKMNDPQFFIENQLADNNPHDDLEPDQSADIIIGHVLKGIEKARVAKLPVDIVQFIQTHHGTSKVHYFLKRALEMNPDGVEEARYTYPGPRPNTKEQAILMMADSVEAASRSLKKYDQASIDQIVDQIIDGQRNDHQFEDAPITYKDISTAKNVLKNALKGIYHQRISYD